MRVKRNFHRILIAMVKPLVKRGPGPRWESDKRFFSRSHTVSDLWDWDTRFSNHVQIWARVSHQHYHQLTHPQVTRTAVLETKAGPSVRDWQLLVRTRNFLHISLQINVWISQNPDQDRQLFQLSPEHWRTVTKPSLQVEDDTEILIRYNVWGRGPKFWTGT